jgi:AraC-like DNA-binding protein
VDPLARRLPPDDVFRRLVAVREQLLDNPTERTSLDDLARRAGFSRFHLVRRWREAFGRTPHDDVTSIRIARAKRLLEGDTSSITEICFDLGYSSLGSFSTLFAERVGCPPLAWRRRFVKAPWVERAPVVHYAPWCFLHRHGALAP